MAEFKSLNLNQRSGRHHSTPKKKAKRKLILGLVCLFLIGALGWLFFAPSSSTSFVFGLVPGAGPNIKSTDDRVNVLLLGNAGGKHDGAELTDSIIVASHNLKTKKTVLISIPRDLWVEGSKSRINATYEIGERQTKDGLKYAEDKIDDILGIPIHYGLRIDFDGFAKAIDVVNGVEVDVPRSFDDYRYPIAGREDDLCDYQEKEVDLSEEDAKKYNLKTGKQKVLVDLKGEIATDSADFNCRYEHLSFDRGVQHMDGTLALKYVRSRHALGPEGSDFARSKRQQLVIQAFREKLLSLQTLSNPQKIAGLIGTFGDSVETDIGLDLYMDFYDIAKNSEAFENVVLGDLGNGKSLLINPPPSSYGGAWVLIPPNNDFTPIQEYLKQQLEGLVMSPSPVPSSTSKSSIQPKKT